MTKLALRRFTACEPGSQFGWKCAAVQVWVTRKCVADDGKSIGNTKLRVEKKHFLAPNYAASAFDITDIFLTNQKAKFLGHRQSVLK